MIYNSSECQQPTPIEEEKHLLIDDNIDATDVETNENIFFMKSRHSVFHKLDSHQACSIESAGNY